MIGSCFHGWWMAELSINGQATLGEDYVEIWSDYTMNRHDDAYDERHEW